MPDGPGAGVPGAGVPGAGSHGADAAGAGDPRASRLRFEGLRFAFGTLSVLRVRVERWDRPTAGRAMLCAPVVGIVLGALAAALGALVSWRAGGPLGAVTAVAALAALTRGLHLDGLADVADGLGSGKPAEDALRIMKQSDIGPFGVLTLLLTLLGQIAALAGQFERSPLRGALAVLACAVTARCALAWGCLRSVPAARPGGLGAMVASTVPTAAALAVSAAAALLLALAGLADGWSALRLPLALVAGLLGARLLLRRCVRRFDGITGDVLGATAETAATCCLLTLALAG